jgi:preprotein translocase subunit SecY
MLKAGKSLPVSYSRKMSNTMVKVPGQDLTLKMLPGTVIPLIFTSTVFSFLSVIFYRLPAFSGVFNMSNWFDVYHPGYSVGIILYVLLVTGFTYYYNSISSSAEKISEDLKVMGATVNGYRPGTETVMLIRRKTKYMLLIGALMLSFLSLIPIFIGAVLHVSGIKFIGSSLLIVCSVMSEIRAEIASYRIGQIYSILKMHLKESKVS